MSGLTAPGLDTELDNRQLDNATSDTTDELGVDFDIDDDPLRPLQMLVLSAIWALVVIAVIGGGVRACT